MALVPLGEAEKFIQFPLEEDALEDIAERLNLRNAVVKQHFVERAEHVYTEFEKGPVKQKITNPDLRTRPYIHIHVNKGVPKAEVVLETHNKNNGRLDQTLRVANPRHFGLRVGREELSAEQMAGRHPEAVIHIHITVMDNTRDRDNHQWPTLISLT